jgi:hypothetical protein
MYIGITDAWGKKTPTGEKEAEEEEEVVVEEVEVDQEEGYDDTLVLLGTAVTNFQR